MAKRQFEAEIVLDPIAQLPEDVHVFDLLGSEVAQRVARRPFVHFVISCQGTSAASTVRRSSAPSDVLPGRQQAADRGRWLILPGAVR